MLGNGYSKLGIFSSEKRKLKGIKLIPFFNKNLSSTFFNSFILFKSILYVTIFLTKFSELSFSPSFIFQFSVKNISIVIPNIIVSDLTLISIFPLIN